MSEIIEMPMGSETAKTPEQRELERKRAHLSALHVQLAQRELDLATLHASLRTFETQYLCIIGTRLAELDRLRAGIAEARLRQKPGDSFLRNAALDARAKARESGEGAPPAQSAAKLAAFSPSESLRSLYLELARAVHPDLAVSDDDKARRTALMAEVNRAYEDGDEARLQALLNDWRESPEAVQGEGTGAELVRLIRKIAKIERRLQIIDKEFGHLAKSELYQLMSRANQAHAEGRDLLSEMESLVDMQIGDAREALARIGNMV